MKPQIKLVNTIEGFKALEHDWNKLYEKSVRTTIFSSWDWMFTWWEVFHDELSRKLYILCLYDGDELLGIAPFHIYKHYPKSLVQGKTLQFIASGNKQDENVTSEYLDFIVLPEKESEMVVAVSEYLVKHKRQWDFADFEYLLEDALILDCFKVKTKIARVEKQEGVRFYISPKKSFDEHKPLMGKRWRKMLDRKNRILERDHEVSIVTTDTEESLEPALALLADMHCSRIKDKVGYCAFDSKKFTQFHRTILKRFSPQNKAVIKTLYIGEEPLAIYYVFVDKGQWHYYQSGFYSEHANRYSPLFLLVCREIGETFKLNKVFDFMHAPSENSYKKEQYAAESTPMVQLYWSTMPIRFSIFNTAKFIRKELLSLKAKIKSKREKS